MCSVSALELRRLKVIITPTCNSYKRAAHGLKRRDNTTSFIIQSHKIKEFQENARGIGQCILNKRCRCGRERKAARCNMRERITQGLTAWLGKRVLDWEGSGIFVIEKQEVTVG